MISRSRSNRPSRTATNPRTDLITITGYELVNAKDRDRYVAAIRDLVSRGRDFDGCIGFGITADSMAE